MESSDARTVTWRGEREGDVSRQFATHATFEETCERYFPAVLRYVRSRVGDEQTAEDLAIETFVRAQRAWPGFERRSAVTTWLIGIARHVVADYRRRPDRQEVSFDRMAEEVVDERAISPEDAALRNAELVLLGRALERLTDGEQELLALRYAAGLSLGAIASLLDVREMTVRVRLHRARVRLRALLTALEDSE